MAWLKENWLVVCSFLIKFLLVLALLGLAIYLLGKQWPDVVEFLGGSLIIGGVLTFLGSEAVKSYLGARLETHKSDLLKITAEHSIKFQNLHAERALIIKDIYQLLVSLENAVHLGATRIECADMRKKEEMLKEIASAFDALNQFYWPRKIFFDEDFARSFDSLLTSYKDAFFEMSRELNSGGFKSFEEYEERSDNWMEIKKIHQNSIQPMKKNLENKMRALLGAL